MLKVLSTIPEMERAVLKEIASHLNVRLPRLAVELCQWLQNSVKIRLIGSPIFKALVTPRTTLNAHVGLADISQPYHYVDEACKCINVRSYPVMVMGNSFSNSPILKIYMTDNFKEIAKGYTILTAKGISLHYMEGLLGGEWTVNDFYYRDASKYEIAHGWSRTRKGFMQAKKGSRWTIDMVGVPVSEELNWVTLALLNDQPDIFDEMMIFIERKLNE
jgi:hypothetical protein